jgi:chromosome segregation ATPase
MKLKSFFNKKKSPDGETFTFPTRKFEYNKSTLRTQSLDVTVKLIDQWESYLKDCEKSFQKCLSAYESTFKSEQSLQEKLLVTKEKYEVKLLTSEDDLKQLRTGYHKLRNQNEDLEKEIKLLKKPLTKKSEEILGNIHTIVIELVKNSTADKSYAKLYEGSIQSAENFFTQLERHYNNEKRSVQKLGTRIENFEKEEKTDKLRITNLERDFVQVSGAMSQKTVEYEELKSVFDALSGQQSLPK